MRALALYDSLLQTYPLFATALRKSVLSTVHDIRP
jgi:hypothetical protein